MTNTKTCSRLSRRFLRNGILILILISAIGLAVWYHIPITVSQTAVAYTSEGESKEITLHFQVFRYFFKPAEASGYIEMDQVKFVDPASIGIRHQKASNGWVYDIQENFSGNVTLTFVDSTLDKIDCFRHRMDVTVTSSDWTSFEFFYFRQNEAFRYTVSTS